MKVILEVQKEVYICFLNYEKAFDRVRLERMQCLSEIGIDGKDIRSSETCIEIKQRQ